MFFGNEKRNRKSRSEEKKVRGKIIYFYGLESGLDKARKIFLELRRLQVGEEVLENFLRFFYNFLQFFYNFLENFYNFSENFSDFLENFLRFFGKFFTIFLRFFGNFSENSHPQSVAVQPSLAIIVNLQLSLQLSLHLYL